MLTQHRTWRLVMFPEHVSEPAVGTLHRSPPDSQREGCLRKAAGLPEEFLSCTSGSRSITKQLNTSSALGPREAGITASRLLWFTECLWGHKTGKTGALELAVVHRLCLS